MNATATARPKYQKSKTQTQQYRDDPEVTLMLRVRNDDTGAFGELLRRYWAYVFGRCYRRLHDREEAEDLAQEVFLRVYRSRKRYQPRAKFSTWLFHITQNLLRNTLRSRRRHPCLRLDSRASSPILLEHFFADHGESPTRPLERAELARVVRTAVSHLANRQRTAVELQQFHNSSYAEVAAEMDMTPKAAKSLLYRARNQLRTSLSPFMEEGW